MCALKFEVFRLIVKRRQISLSNSKNGTATKNAHFFRGLTCDLFLSAVHFRCKREG